MKRMHLHLPVEDLDRNVAIDSRLLGAGPSPAAHCG